MSLGDLFFTTWGRIPRSTYWYFMLPYALISCVASVFDLATWSLHVGSPFGHCTLLLFLVAGIPAWSIVVKRCRDRGHPNWYVLLSFIPIIGPLWLLVELGLRRGTRGPNKYGPDPLAPRQVPRLALEPASVPASVAAPAAPAATGKTRKASAPRKAPAKRGRKKSSPTIPC